MAEREGCYLMRGSEITKFNGKEITVKELHVSEIRKVLSSFDDSRAPHMVEVLFEDPIPLLGVTMATGLTAEDLDGDVPPSEVDTLLGKVREINPFLKGVLARIAAKVP